MAFKVSDRVRYAAWARVMLLVAEDVRGTVVKVFDTAYVAVAWDHTPTAQIVASTQLVKVTNE